MERTSAGTLRVKGKLTKTGVFEYQRGDSTVRELRSPEHVFDPIAMDSLRGAHVTIDHPRDFVDSDNWKLHSVGTVLSVDAEPPYVTGELAVHDGRAQELVEGGWLKEISCGYFCKPQQLEDTTDADVAQTQIQYNHAALGPEGWGRLGSDVGLTLDGRGDQKLYHFEVSNMNEKTADAVEQQDALPLEPPPVREEVRALAKTVDSMREAFSELATAIKEQAAKPAEEKPYKEISEQPTLEEVQDSIEDRARDLLKLELRARSAYETIFPKRQTIDTLEPFAKGYCEEILGLDSQHGYELKELVERAEIKATGIAQVREEEQKRDQKEYRSALLGKPFNQFQTSDPFAYMLKD